MKKLPKNNSSVNSLTKGIKVLKFLANRRSATATEIAQYLGMHQSSASRLLRSLEEERLVHKPDYHSFAVDYGVLHVASLAIQSFTDISGCIKVCNDIHNETGYGVATAIMMDGCLLYKAQIGDDKESVLKVIDEPNFAIHRSSVGLMLAYQFGKTKMLKMLKESQAIICTERDGTPKSLYDMVDASVKKDGILFLKNFWLNSFNAVTTFQTNKYTTALAIYSQTEKTTPKKIKPVLEAGVAKILELTEVAEQKQLELLRLNANK